MKLDTLRKIQSGQVDANVINDINKTKQLENVVKNEEGNYVINEETQYNNNYQDNDEDYEYEERDFMVQQHIQAEKIKENLEKNKNKVFTQYGVMTNADPNEIAALLSGKRTSEIVESRKVEKPMVSQPIHSKNNLINEGINDPFELKKRNKPQPKDNNSGLISGEKIKDLFNEEFIYNRKLEKIIKNLILEDEGFQNLVKEEVKNTLKELLNKSKK